MVYISKSILFVDDEQEMLNVLTVYFEEYEVRTANNGANAIAELLNSRPGAVITDTSFPRQR